jgi:hypothetical protein
MLPSSSGPQPTVIGDGIWIHGKTVMLFTRLQSCEGHPVQTLVSKDAGKTWAMSGPRLENTDVEFILDHGNDIWMAGENTAEGPSSDIFLLRYNDADWPQFAIYPDESELQGIALEGKTGRLLAWIEHLRVTDKSGGSKGPVYLHESTDGGRTWKIIRKVRHVPKSGKGLLFFREIPEENGPWRISRSDRTVEHQQADGTWQPFPRPPLPPEYGCSDEESNNTNR